MVKFWVEGYYWVYTRLLPYLWMPTHCAEKQSHFFSITLLYQTVFYREHRFYLGKKVFDSIAFIVKKWT